jgi:hypothetical protein
MLFLFFRAPRPGISTIEKIYTTISQFYWPHHFIISFQHKRCWFLTLSRQCISIPPKNSEDHRQMNFYLML